MSQEGHLIQKLYPISNADYYTLREQPIEGEIDTSIMGKCFFLEEKQEKATYF